jgi:hypothetical protein
LADVIEINQDGDHTVLYQLNPEAVIPPPGQNHEKYLGAFFSNLV